jgi:hypothetical protein
MLAQRARCTRCLKKLVLLGLAFFTRAFLAEILRFESELVTDALARLEQQVGGCGGAAGLSLTRLVRAEGRVRCAGRSVRERE